MSEIPPADLAVRLGVDEAIAQQFALYLALLMKWNARMNLTAVRDPGQIVARHFAESVFGARQIPANAGKMLDFGSGAGLPGIPIALCRPEIAVTLAESQAKKAAFLREAVRVLGLKAEVWTGRAEALPAERMFDAVTLRAVDRMSEACRIAAGRLVPEGWIGIFTTRRDESELQRLEGIRWNPVLEIPGSVQEVLLTGTRIQAPLPRVPRGT